jgi:glycerate kinase
LNGPVRVVVAPDGFTGTVSAVAAADALAAGWRDVAPGDELDLVPLADGGPGFAATLGALPSATVVEPGIAVLGRTAYVESAVGCGPEAAGVRGTDVERASSRDVGRLLVEAAGLAGIDAVVVGLGGSMTNDGGAGLWAALGAEPSDVLDGGGSGLARLDSVTVPAALGVRLVAATDVDNPLLGLHGASAVYGPQKGADRAAVARLDAALERWADVVESAVDRPGLRDVGGAGAAGGLGFGLLALGAERQSGVELTIAAVDLAPRVAAADLVVTGEGHYDATSLRGKVVSGVARIAQQCGVPCVVAAGQASVGTRDAAAAGVDEVWSVCDLYGSPDAARAAGSDGLRALGREVARSWSRTVGR